MKFVALIEEFFKQYATILGCMPYLKAEFESVSQYDDYADLTAGKERGAVKKLPKVFTSPRLPFDYTKEEQLRAAKGKKEIPIPDPNRYSPEVREEVNKRKEYLSFTPFSEPWSEAIKRHNVILGYDLAIKLIEIRKAQEDENYNLRDTTAIIGKYKNDHWSEQEFLSRPLKDTYKDIDGTTVDAVRVPSQIYDDVHKWMHQRHAKKQETTDAYELLLKMQKEYSIKRHHNIYLKLLWYISGLKPYSIDDIDIHKYIQNQLHDIDNPKPKQADTKNSQDDYLDWFYDRSVEDPIDLKQPSGQFSVNNKDLVEAKDVYEYFKKHLVDPNYLSEDKLNEYLILAFQSKPQQIPKKRFVLQNNPKKKKIYSIYYNYYHNIVGAERGKQTGYAELLGEYFAGYNTPTTYTNMNKD